MYFKICVLAYFLLSLPLAQAQTFDPGYGAEVSDKQVADEPSTRDGRGKSGSGYYAQTATVDTDKDADDAAENSPLVPAKINIGDKKPEKVYDNSVGKVVEYKVVNGKIEFGDPNERKVLVYTENYQVLKGVDGMTRCKMRVYVLNDFKERINSLSFKLIWPEIQTTIQMNRVNPGVRTYSDIMLLGDGCFSMDKTPTIEVNRCRVKGQSEEKCASAIRWFKKDKK